MYIFLSKESLEIIKISDEADSINESLYAFEIDDVDAEDFNNIIKESLDFKMKCLRKIRDHRLLESDKKWIRESTKTGGNPNVIKDYKQLLRDLPVTADLTEVSFSDLLTVFPAELE